MPPFNHLCDLNKVAELDKHTFDQYMVTIALETQVTGYTDLCPHQTNKKYCISN